ncbi:MAG: hypothetical protein WD970_00355 [Patescibacteria group bacterium]
MERETSTEEQREAIKFEVSQLAERHGISLTELVNIIGETDSPSADKTESSNPNDNSSLVEQLRVLTGRRWEGYAYHGDIRTDEMGQSDSKIVEILEELHLTPGVNVVVERSGGEIEDDWSLSSIDVETGEVHVTKAGDGGHALSKSIPITKFLERNLGIQYH